MGERQWYSSRSPGREPRRWWLVVLGIAVFPVAVWVLLGAFVDAEGFRPELARRLSEAVAMQVKVARLEWRLLPIPALEAHGIEVGDDALRLDASSARLALHVGDLLRGRLRIHELLLRDLVLTVSAQRGEARKRISEIQERAGARSSRTSSQRTAVRVTRVSAPQAEVRVVGVEQPVAVVDIEIQDIKPEQLHATMCGRATALGESAAVNARADVYPSDGEPRFDGVVELADLDTAVWHATRNLPPMRADLSVTVRDGTPGRLQAELKGRLAYSTEDSSRAHPLDGMFWGTAYWNDGTLTVDDLHYTAAGASLVGDATWYPSGDAGVEVHEGRLNALGVAELAAWLAPDGLGIEAHPDAAMSLQKLLIARTQDRPFAPARGEIAFSGLGLAWASAHPPVGPLAGRVSIEGGVFRVQELTGEDLRLAGAVTPDAATGRLEIEASGRVGLSDATIGLLPSSNLGWLHGVSGDAVIAEATFRVGPGGLDGDSFACTGSLENVAGTASVGTASDEFANVSGTFEATAGRVTAALDGDSRALRTLHVEGAYDVGAKRWTGAVQADLSALAAADNRDSTGSAVVRACLAQLGQSRVVFDLTRAADDELVVEAHRDGEPPVKGSLRIQRSGERWLVAALDASATLDASGLAPALPVGMTATGPVRLQLQRRGMEDPARATLDLTGCRVDYGGRYAKPAGLTFTVFAEGSGGHEPFAPRRFAARCLDQEIAGVVDDGTVLVDSFDLLAAPLAQLSLEPITLTGRVTGAFRSQPPHVVVGLRGFGVTKDDARIEWVDGELEWSPGGMVVHAMTIRTAGIDLTTDLEERDGHWTGSVTAPEFDVDAARAVWDGLRSTIAERGGTNEERPRNATAKWTCAVGFAAKEVVFRGARFSSVGATLTADADSYRVSDLSAVPGSGSLRGEIVVGRGSGSADRRGTVRLEFAQADARVIDQLAFATPRGLSGAWDGSVNAEFPVAGETPALHGASGAATVSGRNGSFGRMGLATKLLAALRTLDVLALRLPDYTDGLTYDSFSARIEMVNGVANLTDVTTDNPVLLIEGGGTIDYVNDTTEVAFRVSPSGPLTGALDFVGLGEVARDMQQRAALTVVLTGSPEDPDYRLDLSRSAMNLLRETVDKGRDLLNREITGPAAERIRQLLGR